MPTPNKITRTEIRMYKLGTGDCFGIKFYDKDGLSYKLMIDCGTWQGKKEFLSPYVSDLLTWLGNEVDLLVITHEHKDHVYGFEACELLFVENFNAKEVWMAWTENDTDQTIQDWMKRYGQKKKALARSTEKISAFVEDDVNYLHYEHDRYFSQIVDSRKNFSKKLSDLVDLQFSLDDKVYAGNLTGMKIIKEKIALGKLVFKEPGDIIRGLKGLPGVNIYVLGPPKSWASIKKENGGEGESYKHNREIFKSDAFAAAILNDYGETSELLPFDRKYVIPENSTPWKTAVTNYKNDDTNWRNIDFDWLQGAGDLALRVSSMTNNLSLALAFEFEPSKKVMLFPGDAEFGSWASWHEIEWDSSVLRVQNSDNSNKGVVEDLLNKTVFYKVAHHLSHNGTAKRLGLEMMTSGELVAMATLDYDIISEGWMSTMPNVEIIKELVRKTKGRLIVMNEKGLLADRKTKENLTDYIKKGKSSLSPSEKKEFDKNCKVDAHYIEYSLKF
jgi:beta-lactamase superfamily II metal-dependent hydrolase